MTMFDIKIRLLEGKEKLEKPKLIEPNVVFNRLDLRYPNTYEIIEINYKGKLDYITFNVFPTYCYLGLYMKEIDKKIFESIYDFIAKKFGVTKFYVWQSLNDKKLKHSTHSLIHLPSTQEEFESRFSSKSRYNRKRELKKLFEKYNCYFTNHKISDLDESFFQGFLDMKKVRFKDGYSNTTPKDFLTSGFYSLTNVYTLTINEKIAAYVLCSSLDNKRVYLSSITFDEAYSKYGIGVMLLYHAIEDLIKRGFKEFDLGGMDYDYKRNTKAVVTSTYYGTFTHIPLTKKLFSIFEENKDGRLQKYLNLLGIKILIKKNKISSEDYSKYYKKIKLDKKIKKMSKEFKNKKIVIYGSGIMTKEVFENYELKGLNIVAVCDKKYENEKNAKFYGYDCISPEELKNLNFDIILISLLKSGSVINELRYSYKNKTIKDLIY